MTSQAVKNLLLLIRHDALCDRRHGWVKGANGVCVRAKRKERVSESSLRQPSEKPVSLSKIRAKGGNKKGWVNKNIQKYQDLPPGDRKKVRVKSAIEMAKARRNRRIATAIAVPVAIAAAYLPGLIHIAHVAGKIPGLAKGQAHIPFDSQESGKDFQFPSDQEFFNAKLEPLVLNGESPTHSVFQTEIGGKPYFVKEAPSLQACSEVAAKRIADELELGDYFLPAKAVYNPETKKSYVMNPLVSGFETLGSFYRREGLESVPKLSKVKASQIVTYDRIVGNPDRHLNNIMYNKETGDFLFIDQGYSLINMKYTFIQDQQVIPAITDGGNPIYLPHLLSEDNIPQFKQIIDESYSGFPKDVRQYISSSLENRVRRTPQVEEVRYKKP